MEYRHCFNNNFEDLSSGRVIYGNQGIPNFPVRLGNEIFRRCLEYIDHNKLLTVYDPCCGGAYLLTVLGFCNSDRIGKIVGSDIDQRMVEYAVKNTALLTRQGLKLREQELNKLLETYNKPSHIEALKSVSGLEKLLHNDICSQVYQLDCTKEIEESIHPDLIITDVPYGNLVDWKESEINQIELMMEQLARISHEETVLSIITDKKQKVASSSWKRVEKQIIGKRKFEIYLLK